MKLKLVVIVLSLFLVACGSSKKTNYKETKTDAIIAFQKPIRAQNISMEE